MTWLVFLFFLVRVAWHSRLCDKCPEQICDLIYWHLYDMFYLYVCRDSSIFGFRSCHLTHSCVRRLLRIDLCFGWLICMWHDAFICESWLIRIWHAFGLPDAFVCFTQDHSCVWSCVSHMTTHQIGDVSHSYVWNDWFVWHGSHTFVYSARCSYVWHVKFKRVTWLIHVYHDSCICVIWQTLLCDCCSPIIRVIFLIHMWDISHSHVWHDSFLCVI